LTGWLREGEACPPGQNHGCRSEYENEPIYGVQINENEPIYGVQINYLCTKGPVPC